MALFLDHSSYASAIILSGAAEEIFGKALTRIGKESILEWQLRKMKDTFSENSLFRECCDRKKFICTENRVRNALKHLGENDSEAFAADLEWEACWMLSRACSNASKLGIDLSRYEEFDDWFYANIVGM